MFYSSTFCREQAGRPKCPVDPFFIVPDKCKCVDFQVCVCVAECSPVVGSQDSCLMSVSCWSSAGAETAGEP